MSPATRVNLFLVYSPLHCLAAERIVDYFEADAKNCVFYLKPKSERLLNKERWDIVAALPWPRFYPLPGIFGRLRRTLENLRILGDACIGADEILLHTPVIDTEAVNYAINYLRRRYPAARLAVRLTPDGLLNVKRHPQPIGKRLMQYLRKGLRFFCPELDYYPFAGDRTGSDDVIVERIYLLPGLPHEYNRHKVVEIPSLVNVSSSKLNEDAARTALVIGQPLIVYKRMTAESVAVVTQGIREFLRQNGYERIFYKAHPRDATHEYCHADYAELNIDETLEAHLASHHYGMVIGVCSTALLTARMILPAHCRVVACGFERMIFTSEQESQILSQPFRQIGIELHEV